MGMRVSKLFGSVFGTAPVARKGETGVAEVRDRDPGSNQEQPQQQQQERREEPTEDEVRKAVDDMAATPSFTQTGMKAEMIKTANGLTVTLKQGGGNVIRTMTALEFMQLRDKSDDKENPRGKLLDQKF